MSNDKISEGAGKGPKKQKKGPKSGATGKPVQAVSDKPTVDIEDVDMPEQTISLFLAIGLVVGALVVGLIVGYVVAPKSGSGLADTVGGGGSAPTLTQEQLQGGELPAGHPTVPGGEAVAPSGTGTPPEAGAPGGTTGEEKPAEDSSKEKKE